MTQCLPTENIAFVLNSIGAWDNYTEPRYWGEGKVVESENTKRSEQAHHIHHVKSDVQSLIGRFEMWPCLGIYEAGYRLVLYGLLSVLSVV